VAEQDHDEAQPPGWLQPVKDACARMTARDLSRWIAPPGSTPRHASVLVLFGGDGADRTVLLLERAHDMRSHAGQVAFPGGAQDASDRDAAAAALREAAEETGLDPAGVTVIGVLPSLWLPPSDFMVTPVVGWWHEPSSVFAVDPAETASVHNVGLNQLLDPAHRVSVRHPSGFVGPGFLVDDLVVWGFTAGVLSRLFALFGWEIPWDDAVVVDLPSAPSAGTRTDGRRVRAGS
jgi:8-oxo-dGTP pyrophosphatase MutT (NUDIX family)